MRSIRHLRAAAAAAAAGVGAQAALRPCDGGERPLLQRRELLRWPAAAVGVKRPAALRCEGAAQEPERRQMYPELEPYKTGYMKTKDGLHELYIEECGNPNGKPALFLHGGPAAGISPWNRRIFDPEVYRIILLDQRGAGKSRPNASLEANTTWHLVDDLEQLREHVGVDRWHVVYGGSWGSTLALAYAQKNATRVNAMVLRGIFLFDHEDMAWLFEEGGASEFFPDKFERYKSIIPQGERGSLINAYYRRLTCDDEKTRLRAACHFVEWEASISKITATSPEDLKEALSEPTYILPFARAETHYFVNGGWFERHKQLLDDCKCIEHIPCHIVHGRYDCVCRPRMAWELHKRLPLSTLEFADTSGHSGNEPNTLDATVRALDKFAEMA